MNCQEYVRYISYIVDRESKSLEKCPDSFFALNKWCLFRIKNIFLIVHSTIQFKIK